jgi:16S rRNA A1518/A1519 N6-dimethyltransferase RsmA/KsgA/DIM1 with predicted DNA glycosylase/AP lyase activity
MVSNLSILFFVKPTAFFPPPKVESAVIQISWKEKPIVEVNDQEWFKKIVKGCFSYRRKTLINALKHSGPPLPNEIEACEPYLIAQLKLINPRIICALGTFAAQTLLRTDQQISRLRGRFLTYQGIKLSQTSDIIHLSYSHHS